jgi:hypothetical protein
LIGYKIKCTKKNKHMLFLGSSVVHNDVYWDTLPCNPLKVNRRFGGYILWRVEWYDWRI